MSNLFDFKDWSEAVASMIRAAEGSSAISFWDYTRPYGAAMRFRDDGFSGGEWKSPLGMVLLSDHAGPANASLVFYPAALKDDARAHYDVREPQCFSLDGDSAKQAAKQIIAWLGDTSASAFPILQ
jgi:hypothetical protein